MRITCVLIVTVVLFVLGGCCAHRVHQDQQPAVAAPLIVDVRTEQEWKEGHLEGAVLIPYDRIEQGITAVAPDKKGKIYLYCRSGRRTGIAFDALKRMGYEDLVNLETLEKASQTLGKPVVK